MKTEFTKGEWSYDTDDLGTWINSDLHPEPIAKMGTSINLPKEANAKLISAAPEMFERLEKNHEIMLRAYSVLSSYKDGQVCQDLREEMKNTLNAIKKATE